MSIENAINNLANGMLALAKSLDKYADVKIGVPTKPKAAPDAQPQIGVPTKPQAAPDPEASIDDFLAATDDAPFTIDDVRAKLTEVAKALKPQMSLDILSRKGCQKLPDLKPEHYGDIIELCDKALAGEPI